MNGLMILALLLSPRGLHAADAQEDIDQAFAQIEEISSREKGEGARTVADLERQVSAFKPRVLKWKEAAVGPLSKIALDSSREPKVRVWAVSFMALTHDISALPPLKALMLDAKEPAALRSAAALDIPELQASKEELSRAYCPAFLDKELPPGVLHPALLYAADLGCDETKGLEWWAKHWGTNPKEAALREVEQLLSALGRSRPLEAARALFRLFDFYRPGTFPRRLILEALAPRQYQLRALGGEAARFARQAAIAEAANLPAAVAAVLLISEIGDRGSIPLLLKLLDNDHPEVVAAAAETLAKFKAPQARAPLEKLLSNIHKDPRFSPEHNEPEKLAGRVEAALKALP